MLVIGMVPFGAVAAADVGPLPVEESQLCPLELHGDPVIETLFWLIEDVATAGCEAAAEVESMPGSVQPPPIEAPAPRPQTRPPTVSPPHAEVPADAPRAAPELDSPALPSPKLPSLDPPVLPQGPLVEDPPATPGFSVREPAREPSAHPANDRPSHLPVLPAKGAPPNGRPVSETPATASSPLVPSAARPGNEPTIGIDPLMPPGNWMAIAVLTGVALAAPAFALYSRVARSRLLENRVRKALFEFVASNPGCGAGEAARAVGVHSTTAREHLLRLSGAGVLVAVAAPAGRRYFVTGANTVEAHASMVLRNERNRRVLAAVGAGPYGSTAELARRLGLAKSTVVRRIGILRAAGLVRMEGGRYVVTGPREPASQ